MSRLWSPAGTIPDGKPPFGVWVGDPVLPARDPDPPAPALWRRSVTLLLVAGMLATAMVAGSVVAMVDRLGASTPRPPTPVQAPSLAAQNAAHARGDPIHEGH
jgi:hypothetical protein